MNDFDAKVKKFIIKHQLIPDESHILIGVSGGPDSLALLHFLKRIQEEMQLKLTVAHVDHMFRGEESYEDMKYVEKICREWNIPFQGERINVPKEIKKRKSASSEAVARELRYTYFASIMEKYHIPILALAHHGDDQIETILMRLTRGTTSKAAGIQVKRPFADGVVIRPFLCVTKNEIEKYLEHYRLQPVYDPTNKSDIYTRNRYRKYILPFLKKENPNVHVHFQRFSEQLIEDEKYLMELTKETYNKIVIEEKVGLTLSIKLGVFLESSLPLQRRCIHLILNYLYQNRLPENLSANHIDAIIELIKSPNPSGELHLPDKLKVYRSYEKCIFTFSLEKIEPYIYTWQEGETITFPNGSQLKMFVADDEVRVGNEYFILDDNTTFPLYVRSRKNGDRIRLKGMKGSKKIKSLFIDNKIPIPDRDTWPIVTDRQGEILWVPLLKKSKYESSRMIKGKTLILQYIKQSDFWEEQG